MKKNNDTICLNYILRITGGHLTCFQIFAGIKANISHDPLAPILTVNRRVKQVIQQLAESFSKEVHSQT